MLNQVNRTLFLQTNNLKQNQQTKQNKSQKSKHQYVIPITHYQQQTI